jgi:predicted MFS family arabinose efflux permease
LYYGWFMVAIAFVSQFIVTGACIQSFPVFLLPLANEFEVSRVEASLLPVALMLTGIVLSPLIGRAVARFPIRNVMVTGALVMSLGFFCLSRAQEFEHLLLLYGLTGSFSMGALGIISCNSLIVNWFEERRSMALGIAMIGMSLSGAVQIPLVTWGIANWGWREVFSAYSIAALALVPLLAAFVVTRPSDVGLAPDGVGGPAPEPTDAPAPREGAGPTWALLSTPALWWIAAACGLTFWCSQGLMTHGQAFAIERGIDPMGAAGMLSAISVGAAGGKLLFGWLADRLGESGAFAVALAVQLVAILGFIAFTSYAAFVSSAAVYGLGLGGVSPLQAALLARRFGPARFAPAMGLLSPLMIPFQITGPPITGYLFDTRGSYEPALWLFLGALVAAAVALSFVRLSSPAAFEAAAEPPPAR